MKNQFASMLSEDSKTTVALEPSEHRDQVERHLAEILESLAFRSSPKCSAFLKFVVLLTLDGRTAAIKERTIGVEVFGRKPGFETSSDPIVRVKANEVRKRLAQFYQQAGSANSVTIELSPGSYVPAFRWKQSPAPSPDIAPLPAPFLAPDLPTESRPPIQRRFARKSLILLFACVSLLLLSLSVLLINNRARLSPLDVFWAPLLESPNPVVACVGSADLGLDVSSRILTQLEGKPGPVPLEILKTTPGDVLIWKQAQVGWNDSLSLIAVDRYFIRHNKPLQVRLSSEASAEAVRQGQILLIGLYSNAWTLELTRGLRVSPTVDIDAAAHRPIYRLIDKQKPNDFRWSQIYVDPPLDYDYALIARVRDHSSGLFFIIVGGISSSATLVATEFVLNPVNWQRFSETAPKDWASRNSELVLKMPVVDNSPGAPSVVGSFFW